MHSKLWGPCGTFWTPCMYNERESFVSSASVSYIGGTAGIPAGLKWNISNVFYWVLFWLFSPELKICKNLDIQPASYFLQISSTWILLLTDIYLHPIFSFLLNTILWYNTFIIKKLLFWSLWTLQTPWHLSCLKDYSDTVEKQWSRLGRFRK